MLSLKLKSGISHGRLRPTLAIVGPLLTMSLPPEVTASSGMDIVCHALESYTARWYTGFDRKKPEVTVTYCGSNPVSDLWSERAMTLLAGSFRTMPHGQSVSLTAPDAFRFSFSSAPERHLRAAALLALDHDTLNDQSEQLPSVLVDLMRDIGITESAGSATTRATPPTLCRGR